MFSKTLAQNVGTLIMFAVRRAFSRPDRLRELLQELAASNQVSRELAETGLSFLEPSDAVSALPDAAYRFVRDEPSPTELGTASKTSVEPGHARPPHRAVSSRRERIGTVVSTAH